MLGLKSSVPTNKSVILAKLLFLGDGLNGNCFIGCTFLNSLGINVHNGTERLLKKRSVLASLKSGNSIFPTTNLSPLFRISFPTFSNATNMVGL